jgi:hypothetical protein
VLIDPPALTDAGAAGACRGEQQRDHAVHRAEHAQVVDRVAALSEPLLPVSGGQPLAQIPAHRHCDQLRGDADPGAARHRSQRYFKAATTHQLNRPPADQPPHATAPRRSLALSLPVGRACGLPDHRCSRFRDRRKLLGSASVSACIACCWVSVSVCVDHNPDIVGSPSSLPVGMVAAGWSRALLAAEKYQ